MIHSLPFHIIKEVVVYAVDEQHEYDDMLATFASQWSCLCLLHICRSWRNVALSIMFSKCNAQIGETVYFSYCGIEKMPWRVGYLHSLYNSHVKTVVMKLDFQSIVDGSAVNKLNKSWITFPYARFLNIELRQTQCKTINNANVAKFVSTMQHMLPAIHSVDMCASGKNSTQTNNNNSSLTLLLEHLCLDKKLVNIMTSQEIHNSTIEHMVPANSLTALHCQWDFDNYLLVSQAIHANAESLCILLINIYTPEDISKIFISNSGYAITFSCLSRLMLRKCCEEIETPPSVPDVVPFPNLQYLEFNFAYPFGDNVLFRENHLSLKGMCVYLNYKLIHILTNIQNNSRGLPLLTNLVITKTDINLNKHYATTISRFLSLALTRLESLYIYDYTMLGQLIKCTATSTKSSNLQWLTVLNCKLSPTQVFTLLQALPSIEVITFATTQLENNQNTIELVAMLKILTCQLKQSNLRLRTWKFPHSSRISINITALLIIFLCSACPHLKKIMIPKYADEQVLQVFTRVCAIQCSGEFDKLLPKDICFMLTKEDPYMVIQVSTKECNLILSRIA